MTLEIDDPIWVECAKRFLDLTREMDLLVEKGNRHLERISCLLSMIRENEEQRKKNENC